MEEEGESSQKKSRSNPPAATAAAAGVDSLTDDLKVEILSLLPFSSVHRFKRVSRSWRDLIAHPDHRKKLHQALAGFFYDTWLGPTDKIGPYFADVSGDAHPPVDTSLSFLPPKFSDVDQLDTCAGLLLCRCYCSNVLNAAGGGYVYFVCNPATEKWVELPPNPKPKPNNMGLFCHYRLAFDPAISSHFHVFEFEQIYITGVNIYSSKTGAWNHRESGWNHITLSLERRSIFLNGMLHLITGQSVLVAVDTEGMLWRTIPLPPSWQYGSIGLSQGRLIFVNSTRDYGNISFWCLVNYESKEWVLKHSVSAKELFGNAGPADRVIAVHPDHDMIFLTTQNVTALVLLDMKLVKFRHILNLEKDSTGPFLPYVPLF